MNATERNVVANYRHSRPKSETFGQQTTDNGVGDVEKDGVEFYEMGSGSRIYQENTGQQREKVSLKMETLDGIIVKKYQMPKSCFIKLDVQGAEIDVLKGATELLKRIEFILLEISTLNYNYKAPQFADVIIFLKNISFVLLISVAKKE